MEPFREQVSILKEISRRQAEELEQLRHQVPSLT